jgi:hypothetical protein
MFPHTQGESACLYVGHLLPSGHDFIEQGLRLVKRVGGGDVGQLV